MMALTVEAPEIERRITRLAKLQGIAPDAYLLQLVAAHLPVQEALEAMPESQAGM